MKLSSFTYLIGQGLVNIWKNRVMAFASFCVLMVSILLVGFSLLFGMNVNRIVDSIENKNEVIVFLDEDITDELTYQISDTLSAINNITSIEFYSKEVAYEDLKKSMKGYEEIFDSLGGESPLIDSYRVKITDTSVISSTVETIEGIGGVYSVKAPFDFANILTALKRTISLISTAIIVALIIVSMVIISNATRASVFARRREINIMKYVGATNSFIRIPFFIEGMFTGVIAGGVSYVITWLGYDSLVSALTQDMSIWIVLGVGGLVTFQEVAIRCLIAYILTGGIIGALGSVISTRKHLKV